MRSAGALIASIGTSVVLVAAVVLSLLSVSAVFALGGFEGVSNLDASDALVRDMRAPAGSSSGSRAVAPPAAVAVVPAAPPRRAAAQHRSAPRRDTVHASDTSTKVTTPAASRATPIGDGTAAQPPPTQDPAAPPTGSQRRTPNVGDGVRSLGDGLSATVQQTGTKLAEATAPLGGVISTAEQQVLTFLAGLANALTDGLGRVLGAQP